MQEFRKHTGLVAPLDRANIDTDQIIPKQFLKRIERTGYGEFLFYDWRNRAVGQPADGFVLNQPRYQGATILAANRNFGCGSSREHAVWALEDFGFRVIIAPSFADIFANNCTKNGLLTITLMDGDVQEIMRRAENSQDYRLRVDLEQNLVSDEHGLRLAFAMDPFRRHCYLNALDDIALTLQSAKLIDDFESRRRAGVKLDARS